MIAAAMPLCLVLLFVVAGFLFPYFGKGMLVVFSVAVVLAALFLVIDGSNALFNMWRGK